jgi:hypothetical protein
MELVATEANFAGWLSALTHPGLLLPLLLLLHLLQFLLLHPVNVLPKVPFAQNQGLLSDVALEGVLRGSPPIIANKGGWV